MIQRPLQATLEIQKEPPAHQEADKILSWVVHGLPFANNPLFSRKSSSERADLLQALRDKLQAAFTELGLELNKPDLSREKKERLKLLNSYLLSFYPYSEPESGARLSFPQEVEENHWVSIEYRVKRLDLSPQSGFLASLFKKEDRLHAYALETEAAAQSHLLFMGTPFPINHGSNLGMLHNFSLRASPGEAHDRTRVNEWLATQTRLTVVGHSQGALIAMIIAAEQAHKVSKALCFCSAKLYQSTLDRLSPRWEQAAAFRPCIQVYTPEGDPLFIFGSGFLPGTEIYKMVFNRQSTQLHDLHIPSGAGSDSFQLVELKKQPKLNSFKEDFVLNAAVIASPLIFAARYLKFYNKLLADKFGNRYLAPLALFYLGCNWLLYKNVTKKASAFWALLASFFLIQKSHKAARAFWIVAQAFGVVLGAIYAGLLFLPQQLQRILFSTDSEKGGSSALIIAALKLEGSSLLNRTLPLTQLNQLKESLVTTKKYFSLLYSLRDREQKARASGLLPPFEQDSSGKTPSPSPLPQLNA